MDDSSCGFGDKSPILYKPTKKLNQIQISTADKLSLEDLHKRLLHYLKKSTTLSKRELKMYFDQVKKMDPEDHKGRWLLMKVKGLLNYILKRRSDFHCSIVKGEITIYEKTASQEVARVTEIPEPPKYHSQPISDAFDLPASFLTNNDFLTVKSERNPPKMEVELSQNYSEDLFDGDDNIESLRGFSQENFQMLKNLTHNSEASNACDDDKLFKVPSLINKIDNAYKVHESLEENYDLLFTETSDSETCDFLMKESQNKKDENASDSETCDFLMMESQNKKDENADVFDLTITNNQFFEVLTEELKQTEKWVSDVTYNLINLDLEAGEHLAPYNVPTENKENVQVLNESTTSCESQSVQTYHSEVNLKIIRDVCSEFKRDLEKNLKSRRKLEILRDLLHSSNK